jgi:hypothetical protein
VWLSPIESWCCFFQNLPPFGMGQIKTFYGSVQRCLASGTTAIIVSSTIDIVSQAKTHFEQVVIHNLS